MLVKVWPVALADNLDTLNGTQMNQLDTNVSYAIDGVNGGAYSPSAEVGIGGSGLRITNIAGASSNVMLTSRSIQRQQPLTGGPQNAGTWRPVARHTWQNWAGSPNEALTLCLDDLPEGNVLQSVTVRFKGAAGHVNSPIQITAPTVQVFTVDDVDSQISIGGPISDPTCALGVGAPAAYEAWHDIVVPAMAHTINAYSYRYIVEIVSEVAGGEVYIAGAQICQAYTAVDCTRYTEY